MDNSLSVWQVRRRGMKVECPTTAGIVHQRIIYSKPIVETVENVDTLRNGYNDKTLIKWKVYYFAGYYSFERSTIIKACVGHEQLLNIKEVIEKPKCLIEDFLQSMKDITKPSNFKKDECYCKTIINELAVFKRIRNSHFGSTVKLFNVDDVNGEEDVLKSLYESNKIIIDENVSLSYKQNKIVLLLLVNICQKRLFSNFKKGHARVINATTGERSIVPFERLVDDKDFDTQCYQVNYPYRAYCY